MNIEKNATTNKTKKKLAKNEQIKPCQNNTKLEKLQFTKAPTFQYEKNCYIFTAASTSGAHQT